MEKNQAPPPGFVQPPPYEAHTQHQPAYVTPGKMIFFLQQKNIF